MRKQNLSCSSPGLANRHSCKVHRNNIYTMTCWYCVIKILSLNNCFLPHWVFLFFRNHRQMENLLFEILLVRMKYSTLTSRVWVRRFDFQLRCRTSNKGLLYTVSHIYLNFVFSRKTETWVHFSAQTWYWRSYPHPWFVLGLSKTLLNFHLNFLQNPTLPFVGCSLASCCVAILIAKSINLTLLYLRFVLCSPRLIELGYHTVFFFFFFFISFFWEKCPSSWTLIMSFRNSLMSSH